MNIIDIFKAAKEGLNKTAIFKKFGRSKEVAQAADKALQRVKNAPCKPEEDKLHTLKMDALKAKFGDYASSLPSSGYSMGENKEFVVTIGVEKILVSKSDCRSYYAKSCKYTPTWGIVKAIMPLSDIKDTFLNGGLITRITGKTKYKNIFHAQYIQWDYDKYRGKMIGTLKPKWIDCFYTPLYEGYHGKTLAACQEYIIYRVPSSEQKKFERKNIKKAAQILKDVLEHEFVYTDSIKSGNCTAGSDAFCQRHNLTRKSTLKGAILLRIAKEGDSKFYINRMIDKWVADNYNLNNFSNYIDKIKN